MTMTLTEGKAALDRLEKFIKPILDVIPLVTELEAIESQSKEMRYGREKLVSERDALFAEVSALKTDAGKIKAANSEAIVAARSAAESIVSEAKELAQAEADGLLAAAHDDVKKLKSQAGDLVKGNAALESRKSGLQNEISALADKLGGLKDEAKRMSGG